MSLVQLESFVTVAEEAHIGRAARRLHISQPPLTRIQQLEDELGVQLFERTPRGVKLSTAGSVLLPEVRAILARVDAMRALARAHVEPPELSVSRGPRETGPEQS